MSLVLTLDLGTTYFKAGVFDADARLLHLRRIISPVRHSRPGRWEMCPDVFFRCILQMIRQLREDCGQSWQSIVAVSFSTQSNSFLLLDEKDRPLTPVILWPDDRAGKLIPELESLVALPDFHAKTGVPKPTQQFMIAKLLWLQRHEPEVWKHMRRIALLSDYLCWWMTGRWITEAGVAGLTGLLDISRLRWWTLACNAVGISSAQLGEPVRAGTDAGVIRQNIANETNLSKSCRLVIGCLDQYAGAIGVGNGSQGEYSETTGTVLSSVRCSDHLVKSVDSRLFQGPAQVEGSFWQMAVSETSARLLESFRAGLPGRPLPTYAELDAEAALIEPGCGGLRLSAWLNKQDKRSNVGSTRGRMVRSILEGVAWALAEQVRTLCGPDRPCEIRSAGGGANSNLWLRIKADMLGVPILVSTRGEPTSAGAACLAITRLGMNDASKLKAAISASLRRVEPAASNHAAYRAIYG